MLQKDRCHSILALQAKGVDKLLQKDRHHSNIGSSGHGVEATERTANTPMLVCSSGQRSKIVTERQMSLQILALQATGQRSIQILQKDRSRNYRKGQQTLQCWFALQVKGVNCYRKTDVTPILALQAKGVDKYYRKTDPSLQ